MIWQEAESLVARLRPILESIGELHLCGSYALDLMTRRDLDLNLRLGHAHDTATAFEAGSRIAAEFEILKMSFSNHYLRTDLDNFDHGLYWGIRLLHNSNEWKVDLWMYGPDDFRRHVAEHDALRELLTDADRDIILEIKTALQQRPEYRTTITSVDIYQAVAESGVTTVTEFLRWKGAQAS